MKKTAVLVIFLLLLSLFSCKSIDFKRIHKEVEEIDSPSSAVTMEKEEETPVVSPLPEKEGDQSLLAPLYEDGVLMSREGIEEAPDEAETKDASESAEDGKAAAPATSVVETDEKKEAESFLKSIPLERILLSLAALLILFLIILVSVKASKAKGRKREKAILSEEKKEAEEQFSYTFARREYELYLGSLDYEIHPGSEEEEPPEEEADFDNPDTIISILSNE